MASARFAFAANAFSILATVNSFLSLLIPVLITLAVVYFIWGVIQYTVSTDEEAKKGARGKIIQGIVGLFVIITFWGIVGLISNTFREADKAVPWFPDFPCSPA